MYNFVILFSILSTVSSAQENENCQSGCHHKLEYCDPYETKCKPCEALCLPPSNPKFAECGKKCVKYLQDILQEHYNEPKHHIHLETLEALLIIVSCVSILTLVGVLALILLKIAKKGLKRAKTNVMPLYNVEGNTIKTLSTSVPDSTSPRNEVQITSRIPVEDRAPSEYGYDNPSMER